MDIQDLLLRKEELPILYRNCFEIPIHPRLLDPKININKKLAPITFKAAALDWYQDLETYAKTLEDPLLKKWIKDVFLKKVPSIREKYGKQVLDDISWEDDTEFMDNGFARAFSISRNSGGSLYFDQEDSGCQTFITFNGKGYIRFSERKAREYGIKELKEAVKAHSYASHNVDHYPSALFLRNWTILYLNQALEQVSKN